MFQHTVTLTYNTGLIGLRVEGSERCGEGGEEVLHVLQLSVGHFMKPWKKKEKLHVSISEVLYQCQYVFFHVSPFGYRYLVSLSTESSELQLIIHFISDYISGVI